MHNQQQYYSHIQETPFLQIFYNCYPWFRCGEWQCFVTVKYRLLINERIALLCLKLWKSACGFIHSFIWSFLHLLILCLTIKKTVGTKAKQLVFRISPESRCRIEFFISATYEFRQKIRQTQLSFSVLHNKHGTFFTNRRFSQHCATKWPFSGRCWQCSPFLSSFNITILPIVPTYHKFFEFTTNVGMSFIASKSKNILM